jgi:transposase
LLRLQKALDQMNVLLHRAVTDITGTTGLAILDAIIHGERNPQKLAALRDPGAFLHQLEVIGDKRSNFGLD